ncbi:hypothetical protein G7046_g3934 [Stylonectria norvegica]|nr:hypothetical protein G7046_g3934 [Stylonectria norvegica]
MSSPRPHFRDLPILSVLKKAVEDIRLVRMRDMLPPSCVPTSKREWFFLWRRGDVPRNYLHGCYCPLTTTQCEDRSKCPKKPTFHWDSSSTGIKISPCDREHTENELGRSSCHDRYCFGPNIGQRFVTALADLVIKNLHPPRLSERSRGLIRELCKATDTPEESMEEAEAAICMIIEELRSPSNPTERVGSYWLAEVHAILGWENKHVEFAAAEIIDACNEEIARLARLAALDFEDLIDDWTEVPPRTSATIWESLREEHQNHHGTGIFATQPADRTQYQSPRGTGIFARRPIDLAPHRSLHTTGTFARRPIDLAPHRSLHTTGTFARQPADLAPHWSQIVTGIFARQPTDRTQYQSLLATGLFTSLPTDRTQYQSRLPPLVLDGLPIDQAVIANALSRENESEEGDDDFIP